jgi:hypothetical protein
MAKVEESSAAAMFPSASLVKPSLLPLEILSVFHDTTSAAESGAFSRLMRHLRETDEAHGTVIMVQVENEVGVLEDSRDRSRAAQEAFDSEVPEPLARFLTDEWETLHPALRGNLETFKRNAKEGPPNPSWSQLFGESDQTDEIFMAYHYARYVETIAAAGKEEYGLPMFTNAWLRSDQTEIKDDNQGGTASAALVTNGTKPGLKPFSIYGNWSLRAWTLSLPIATSKITGGPAPISLIALSRCSSLSSVPIVWELSESGKR